MSEKSAAIRAEALESLLVEKGLLDAARIDDVLTLYNERVGPMNGAMLVAKAWRDAEFKQQLLADGTGAIAQFACVGGEVDKLVVVENTAEVRTGGVCPLWSG
jgi:nitrile hydratase